MLISDRATVLVIDDDPILREFALAELSSDHVRVQVACDGLEGWNRCQEGDIDLVMVDLDMPVLDGFGFIEKIRNHDDLKHLPIVVETSHDGRAAIDRAFSAGATSFVIKPLNWRLVAYQLSYVLKSSREAARVRAQGKLLRGRLRAQDEVVDLFQTGIEYLVQAVLEERPDLASTPPVISPDMPAVVKIWNELDRLRRTSRQMAAVQK